MTRVHVGLYLNTSNNLQLHIFGPTCTKEIYTWRLRNPRGAILQMINNKNRDFEVRKSGISENMVNIMLKPKIVNEYLNESADGRTHDDTYNR